MPTTDLNWSIFLLTKPLGAFGWTRCITQMLEASHPLVLSALLNLPADINYMTIRFITSSTHEMAAIAHNLTPTATI
jgi:hypothetical protein